METLNASFEITFGEYVRNVAVDIVNSSVDSEIEDQSSPAKNEVKRINNGKEIIPAKSTSKPIKKKPADESQHFIIFEKCIKNFRVFWICTGH